MTAKMKRKWSSYRKECLKKGVEPVPADFLGVELTDEELDRGMFNNWRFLLSKAAR